jgi:hypothetical protein
MLAVASTKTFASIYQTARYYMPEKENLNFQRIENLKFHKFISLHHPVSGTFSYVTKTKIQFIKWLDYRSKMIITDLNGNEDSQRMNKQRTYFNLEECSRS